MILELKKRLRIIKKSKKIKVFYFGSTVKKESNNFYITEIKENKKFIYFGAVIFNNYHAKKIAKIIIMTHHFISINNLEPRFCSIKNARLC